MLKEVRKKRAYEDIVVQIQDLITKGRLKRDDQLPNEKEMSETFKVSRSTVREAILSLETLKLVERRQGDGTYVIATSEEGLVQPLASSLFGEKDDLIDIFHIRKIIEPEVAQIAAANATAEDIEAMEKLIREQENDIVVGGQGADIDASFHQLLSRTAKNRVLERLSRALMDLLSEMRGEYLQTQERRSVSVRGHQRILEAVKSGNAKTAQQAMLRHLSDVSSVVVAQKRKRRQKSQQK